MSFSYALPWWALVLAALICVLLGRAAYARTGLTLAPWQRRTLVALRVLALAALVVCLLRPVAFLPPAPGDQGVVALLVDTSRSMQLADAGGRPRIVAATRAARAIAAELGRAFRVDTLTAGERIERADLDRMTAVARRSDLAAVVSAARERYRDVALAAIVLVSDGGETGRAERPAGPTPVDVPVFTVGVGSTVPGRDREIRSLTAGPSALDASLVDLTATLVVHGERRVPVRLLEGRKVLGTRDVDVPADGSPVPLSFTVAPDRASPSVFRVEVAPDAAELTDANNTADVLVPPPGRARRVLMIEGQPGFEHSFLKRAWQQDPSVSLDAVVRKGRNDLGQETFYVQAAAGRTAPLTAGFPVTREALFAYDGLVLANLEPDALTREQQALVADFVGERGGGLLVLGSRALATPLAQGSPLSPVLPLDLADRRGLARASAASGTRLRVAITDEGTRHPAMRLSASPDDSRRRWASLPALAGASLVGAPRAGASVLAVTNAPTGATVPLVAVQRFGAGRTMIFGGEASWHWKMMMPASDRTYDAFWRQSLRWLTGEAPEPVAVEAPATVAPGTTVDVDVAVRNAAFAPVPDASVTVTLRAPDGARDLAPVPADPGHAKVAWQADRPGLYEVVAQARTGETPIGSASRFVLAGGVDPEMVDPRLNDAVLRRLSAGTGGEYLELPAISRIGQAIRQSRAQARPREMRDLWHNGWSLVAIAALLSSEWVLRRRWGLR